ncbi:ribonuclease H [Methylobacterium sp. Leaf104]|uniref:ribonuclease HI n=1 Tax=Methylobacterium TaxID=407 RepID=UPI0007022179|nr:MULTISPECIES: ribonuclease HI [Methylobacterium]KQP30038.1 ribonuclease H [Methylobacterium sp. Leaf104]MCI9882425.1 ribonuclease HI [Methylobacterium goesingense]
MRTIVYADGGCDPNPGPGGWGVVIEAESGRIERCGGDRATTNNRMELTAAINALRHFPEGAQIEMRCDSQYVIKSVTEWMRGWKAKGWRTATGPVKNVELMQELDALAARRDVRWTWVRGHAGEAGNERADRLAAQGRREALGLPPRPETGPAPLTGTAALRAAAAPAVSQAALATAPAAAEPAPARTSAIPLDLGLGLEVSRAAKASGLTPQAYVERAVRLALDLGPEGLERARADLRDAKGAKGAPTP